MLNSHDLCVFLIVVAYITVGSILFLLIDRDEMKKEVPFEDVMSGTGTSVRAMRAILFVCTLVFWPGIVLRAMVTHAIYLWKGNS